MNENTNDLRTSCIDFISSLHGRQRRAEREISVRDLQTAVKYGVKEPQWGDRRRGIRNFTGLRYRITYNNIVYITDETCTKEVTSFALTQLPLEKVTIDQQLQRQIAEQKRRISSGEKAITSHTVVIVDQSTSMNNGDCFGHRSRSRGAYYTIASEMVARPLSLGQLAYTDTMTIIEMRNEAIVNESIYMEPTTWELHNKLVDLANEPLRGRGHGNYIPSLEAAFDILCSNDNRNCALFLLLLSDGAPSDHVTFKIPPEIVQGDMIGIVSEMCKIFSTRLTFGAFGYAHDKGDTFKLLQELSYVAKQNGSKSAFSSGLDTESFRKALFTMSTSLLTTRELLSSIVQNSQLVGGQKKTRRTDIIKDTQAAGYGNNFFFSSDYHFNIFFVQRYRYVTNRRAVKDLAEFEFQKIPFAHPNANGIAINKKYFAEGAEKMALLATEIHFREPVGQPLIAKVSVDDDDDQWEFHKNSARTQMEARRLAKKFNEIIAYRKLSVPIIEFLEVFFYVCEDKSYLVEKRLDVKRYQKFNNNCGGVINESKQEINLELEALPECDESDEEDSIIPQNKDQIIDEDVPQAFSHWTYQYTYGEKLVCDLQGVLTNRFELTDPAIHSKRGRVFGLTDKGRKGMRAFFETHKCNPLCKALRLKPAYHRYRYRK